jgi:hypothetical protein
MLLRKFKRSKAVVNNGKVSILANFNGVFGTLDWERVLPPLITMPTNVYYERYILGGGEFYFKSGDEGKLGSLEIPGSVRTNITNMDFTIELKVKSIVAGNNDELFRYSNNTMLVNRGGNYVSIYIGGAVPELDYMIIPNLNNGQIHHLAFEYHGDRFKVLADGVLIASAVRPNNLNPNGGFGLLRSNAWGTRWAISDFKLTQGEALYKDATYQVPVGDLTL